MHSYLKLSFCVVMIKYEEVKFLNFKVNKVISVNLFVVNYFRSQLRGLYENDVVL
jgi:hypothetical protein